jgi:hypothetical protein
LEQIDYLKQSQDVRMRESLEQALRNNQLLVATIGDLRDELKAAKDALLTQGKVAEEKLIRENEQLHEQLRAAWLSQQTLTKVLVPRNFAAMNQWYARFGISLLVLEDMHPAMSFTPAIRFIRNLFWRHNSMMKDCNKQCAN